MRSWKLILTVTIALVLIVNWIVTRPETVPVTSGKSPETISQVPPVTPTIEPPPIAVVEPLPVTPPPRSEESRAASRRDYENPLVTSYPPTNPPPRKAVDSDPEVAVDFEQVGFMLRDYRTLTGENPVGTNAEIMKALMGGNPKGAQLGPSDGGLNDKGELIDRWGAPYFFHQLSKDLMEIHSAGPDGRFGTSDDIVGN